MYSPSQFPAAPASPHSPHSPTELLAHLRVVNLIRFQGINHPSEVLMVTSQRWCPETFCVILSPLEQVPVAPLYPASTPERQQAYCGSEATLGTAPPSGQWTKCRLDSSTDVFVFLFLSIRFIVCWRAYLFYLGIHS